MGAILLTKGRQIIGTRTLVLYLNVEYLPLTGCSTAAAMPRAIRT